MKNLLLALGLLLSFSVMAQEHKNVTAVKKVLEIQRKAWNNGDVDAFMAHYWKSDNLQFLGSKGLTKGWQNTLDRYKKSYPDKAAMGELRFDIISVDRRSRKVISMVGKFTLLREKDEPSGYFLLIFQKIKGKWRIVADHTS